MTKTLGQAAFEAAHAQYQNPYGYTWDSLADSQRGFWQAAAEAVVAVTTAPNIVSGTIDTKTGNVRIHSPAELTARDKVIEAAKAWHIVHGRKYDRKLWDGHEDELGRAVEALQEARDE